MELAFSILLFSFLFASLSHQPSYCQQTYINETQLNCSANPAVSKGYLCNGPQTCQSFVTFRSRKPYNTPVRIASLLASGASDIVAINNVSAESAIPPDKMIIIPVTCSCFGNIYRHPAPYTVKRNDTYYLLAKEIYQGLSTCQAVISQNYYESEEIPVGVELMVPIRCACPSKNQIANGVISLVSYMPAEGDTLTRMGELFGVSPQSIMDANRISPSTTVNLMTPILIPLRDESCPVSPTSFFCRCSNGQFSYRYGNSCEVDDKDGEDFPVKLIILLGVVIGVGLLCSVCLGYYLYLFLKKRKYKIRKEKFFKQNGGLLLKEQFTSSGRGEKTKLFSAEELRRATDNFNQSRILGRGGYGTVYKGMLLDGTLVAVKRSIAIDKSQIKQFINEVSVLSQINHRNVVRLLGCCLEIEVPLLVYEFVPNGNLSHHLHNQDQECSLPWETRFKIACEVAGALTYMHSEASIPIFHRDIKSSNILLDDKFSAKISDFGTSMSVPSDKTHITTAVQGTFGYLDPEYFQSSQFTDKSDVYSFGVVLAELLTGEKPTSFTRNDQEIHLIAHFISSMGDENKLLEILDPQVVEEAKRDDVFAVARLAKSCLRLNGKKRPTMKQVSAELEGLTRSQNAIEIDQIPLLLEDEVPFAFTRSSGDPAQDSTNDNVSLEMESVSM
ncbi:Kinase, Peptidoglycan-binding LysM [Salix suchowensis]|nr:Kinase, Peptidoglycan-binding LysM [Salix suchowensis]